MLGYRPPLWWAFDDEETGDEMSSTPYEEHQLGELRAKIAALLARVDALESALRESEAALRDILNSDKARMPEGYCSICGEWHGRNPAKDAECMFGRAVMALEGNDNE